jgi:hypothetical protein
MFKRDIVCQPPAFNTKFSGLLNAFFIHKELPEAAAEDEVIVFANLSFDEEVGFLLDMLGLEVCRDGCIFFISDVREFPDVGAE